ncbi:hypothetical protein SNEBB_008874 [Seison nebaliae]|nr:hypothetical protein SNEBB_008874 [Seison nebaliae]
MNYLRRAFPCGNEGCVYDVSTNYYNTRLVTAGADHIVRVYAINKNIDSSTHDENNETRNVEPFAQLIQRLDEHTSSIWRVDWAHPTYGTIFASCGNDGKLIIWDGTDDFFKKLSIFDHNRISVNDLSWTPPEIGMILSCSLSNGRVHMYQRKEDGKYGECINFEVVKDCSILCIRWAAYRLSYLINRSLNDCQYKGDVIRPFYQHLFAVGLMNGEIRVYFFKCEDMEKCSIELLSTIKSETDTIRDICWYPWLYGNDSQIVIASGSHSGELRECKSASLKDIAKRGKTAINCWNARIIERYDEPIYKVIFKNDSNILAVAHGNNNLQLWKMTDDWESISFHESSPNEIY